MPSRPRVVSRIACVWVRQMPEQEAWEQVLEGLEEYSPLVEADGSATSASTCVYLDGRGVAPRYGSEEAWVRAVSAYARRQVGPQGSLGLAQTKFAAWMAAHLASPETGYRIVTGGDATFLAPLSIHWLPLSAEAQRRLQLLGLRTIGQFAALPQPSVAEQFGPESVRAHRWARGLDERLVLARRRQMVEARQMFEIAENRREALIEAAVRISRRALRDLPEPRAAWAIRWVALEATLVRGQIVRVSTWLGDTPGPETMRALLGGLAERLVGAGPGITDLTVRLLGLEPARGRQLDLFAHTEERRQMEQTLDQLRKKHPGECMLQPTVLEIEDPLAAERYGFREYQP